MVWSHVQLVHTSFKVKSVETSASGLVTDGETLATASCDDTAAIWKISGVSLGVYLLWKAMKMR